MATSGKRARPERDFIVGLATSITPRKGAGYEFSVVQFEYRAKVDASKSDPAPEFTVPVRLAVSKKNPVKVDFEPYDKTIRAGDSITLKFLKGPVPWKAGTVLLLPQPDHLDINAFRPRDSTGEGEVAWGSPEITINGMPDQSVTPIGTFGMPPRWPVFDEVTFDKTGGDVETGSGARASSIYRIADPSWAPSFTREAEMERVFPVLLDGKLGDEVSHLVEYDPYACVSTFPFGRLEADPVDTWKKSAKADPARRATWKAWIGAACTAFEMDLWVHWSNDLLAQMRIAKRKMASYTLPYAEINFAGPRKGAVNVVAITAKDLDAVMQLPWAESKMETLPEVMFRRSRSAMLPNPGMVDRDAIGAGLATGSLCAWVLAIPAPNKKAVYASLADIAKAPRTDVSIALIVTTNEAGNREAIQKCIEEAANFSDAAPAAATPAAPAASTPAPAAVAAAK